MLMKHECTTLSCHLSIIYSIHTKFYNRTSFQYLLVVLVFTQNIADFASKKPFINLSIFIVLNTRYRSNSDYGNIHTKKVLKNLRSVGISEVCLSVITTEADMLSKLAVDSVTGVVTIAQEVDRERLMDVDGRMEVEVTATKDAANPTWRLNVSTVIYLHVLDINDNR